MIINIDSSRYREYKGVYIPLPVIKSQRIAIDEVYAKQFGLNYGNHPRNTISFMRSVQDAQQLLALEKVVRELPSSSLPDNWTDEQAFASVASRYGQSFEDFEFQMSKLSDMLQPSGEPVDVVKDDTLQFKPDDVPAES